MTYFKPWTSYAEQIDTLIARGLHVADRALALDYLERIGYYRLSGYWFAFRERSGPLVLLDEQGRKPKKIKVENVALESFKTGATFQNAVDLYVFDKQLRLLAMDALERIEIALRVDISHTLGKMDPFAYLEPAMFHGDFSRKLDRDSGLSRHHEWLGKHAQLVGRSKEEFVRHNKSKYGLPLAIWVACEVWDFGTMSTLFGGMREAEQDAIARQYGINNGRIFATWLRSLNYLRNVCAPQPPVESQYRRAAAFAFCSRIAVDRFVREQRPRPRPLFHAAAPDLPPITRRQPKIKLAGKDESTSFGFSRPATYRPQPHRHGCAGRLGNTMVNWLEKTTGNKKPLSSFPAEAESPRGAVLGSLCNTKSLPVKDIENSGDEISFQNQLTEKLS